MSIRTTKCVKRDLHFTRKLSSVKNCIYPTKFEHKHMQPRMSFLSSPDSQKTKTHMCPCSTNICQRRRHGDHMTQNRHWRSFVWLMTENNQCLAVSNMNENNMPVIYVNYSWQIAPNYRVSTQYTRNCMYNAWLGSICNEDSLTCDYDSLTCTSALLIDSCSKVIGFYFCIAEGWYLDSLYRLTICELYYEVLWSE